MKWGEGLAKTKQIFFSNLVMRIIKSIIIGGVCLEAIGEKLPSVDF